MLTNEAAMLAVIEAATGDVCKTVFRYKQEDGGWQLLLCDDTKNMYRLNESLTPEVLIRIDGQYGEETTWKFIDKKWQEQ